jgi:hypothetical protein
MMRIGCRFCRCVQQRSVRIRRAGESHRQGGRRQRIEYLPDPTGLVNVVAEYDASGNLIARYVHGVGLVSRHDAAGSAAFTTTTPSAQRLP